MSDQHTVDFLQKKYEIPTEREVRAKVSRSGRYIAMFLAVTAVVGTFFSYRIAQITHGDETDVGNLSFFSTFTSGFSRLVGSGDKPVAGEADDRINFLLMGIGGAGHDGPQLADTMIFGSFKPSTHELGMLSIPRDLYVSIPGYGNGKINHANAYGEQKGDGEGIKLASDVVETVTGQPIHYAVRVDFNGFEKLIDELGGIDVYVENSFTDAQYPEYEGSPTYITVSFERGWTHMDGETALQFARSRHGNNGEGTDFARGARQQKILLAVKDKALSAGVLLNPAKLTRLLDTLNDHIDTNLTFWEMVKLAKYAPNVDTNAITMQVLDTSPESPLYACTGCEAYIILPKADDWSDVHEIAETLFVSDGTASAEIVPATLPDVPAVKVEVQNGTAISGLAYQTAQRLDGSSFEVVTIGNATDRTYARTTIYDLTDGRKSAELASLKEFLGADVIMSHEGWVYADDVVPTALSEDDTPGADLVTSAEDIDFLIIVGEDAASLVLR
ncbi:LCP family protein [Candidatus Uhrbacteria bacterium]|nr:LCP family protein [Candidatus Uhrbacteria bacterium]